MTRIYGQAVEIDLADILVESKSWPFRNFRRWYRPAVGLGSVPYGLGWHLTDHAGLVKSLSTLVWPYIRSSMERFLQRHPADVIVSFYPVMDYALALARHRLRLPAPMVGIVVDLVSVHASWFVSDADRFLVPTEEARQRALRCHVPPDRVLIVGGMPVRREFVKARELSKAVASARLRLAQDRPMVLVVGGGEGVGPLEAVVRATTARCPRAQVATIAGRTRASTSDCAGSMRYSSMWRALCPT
jgi:1,2-diacylglycerol 3-beta-galactosyltransferase